MAFNQSEQAPPVSSRVSVYTAHTCSDADSDTSTPGMMSALQNLVPNPGTKDQWVPRPASIQYPNTATMNPIVPPIYIWGDYAVGWTSDPAHGVDVPYIYNLLAGVFVTLTGIIETGVGANCPTTQSTSGEWTTPTITSVAQYLVFTHPGFQGTANYYAKIDTNTFTYSAGNLASGTGFFQFFGGHIPSAVVNFNNRAVFTVNLPAAWTNNSITYPGGAYTFHSNSGDPTTISFPFILSYGDVTPITALSTIGMQNVLGGITHALLIFKQNNIFQMTGDFSSTTPYTGSVLVNSMNIQTGTVAQSTIVQTPRGVTFLSPEGLRIIDWTLKISDPLGDQGAGILLPFLNAVSTTRIVGACEGLNVRYTTRNNLGYAEVYQDWAFDLSRKVWHGPHSFPYAAIGSYLSGFVIAPIGVPGLWNSTLVARTGQSYIENGVPLQWMWKTASIASSDGTRFVSTLETTIYMRPGGGSGGSDTITVSLNDPDTGGESLATETLQFPARSGWIWGTSIWGVDKWGSPVSPFSAVNVPWKQTFEFDRLQLQMNGTSSLGQILGSPRIALAGLMYGVSSGGVV